jgi:hypothetical protein
LASVNNRPPLSSGQAAALPAAVNKDDPKLIAIMAPGGVLCLLGRIRRARCLERAPAAAQQENEFIQRHGFAEYGKWYLGINDKKSEDTKGHYEFPYGDFKKVHRCGLLSAESCAGQYKHFDIENAAAHLHGMLDARKGASSSKRSHAASPGKAARGSRHPAR